MRSCKEIAREIASDDLERRSRLHRFRVRLHLVMCRHCRAYAEQIRLLGILTRHLCATSDPEQADLRRMEEAILDEADRRRRRPPTEPT